MTSVDPYQSDLYSSMDLIVRGETSRSARFSFARFRTSVPGLSTVPLPDPVISLIFRSSMTMTPWFLAIVVVALCAASLLRRAYAACNRATLRFAFSRLREPFVFGQPPAARSRAVCGPRPWCAAGR